MKIVNDIVSWSLSSGALVAAIIFAWKYIKPLLNEKAATASTAQSRQMWQLLEAVADAAVASLVGQSMTGAEKFQQATKNVQVAMQSQGLTIDKATAETAVQAAYEKSPLTSNIGNLYEFKKPTDAVQSGSIEAIDPNKEDGKNA